MATIDEVRVIRQVDGEHDGHGSLEGRGVLIEFRGANYRWQHFDLGMGLYLGHRYRTARLTWMDATPVAATSVMDRPGEWRREVRPASADELDLCRLAKGGDLDRFLDRRELAPRLEDATPYHKPDFA